jgi:hypothetical protein
VIGDLSRCPIEHAIEATFTTQVLHRSAPRSRGMKDKNLTSGRFENLPRDSAPSCRDSEHSERNRTTSSPDGLYPPPTRTTPSGTNLQGYLADAVNLVRRQRGRLWTSGRSI